MSKRRQADISYSDPESNFRATVKGELARRRKSVTWLARTLQRDRSTVSQAINQGRFPRVRGLIAEALGVALP